MRPIILTTILAMLGCCIPTPSPAPTSTTDGGALEASVKLDDIDAACANMARLYCSAGMPASGLSCSVVLHHARAQRLIDVSVPRTSCWASAVNLGDLVACGGVKCD